MQLQHEALEAVFQKPGIEIYQETYRLAGHSQTGQNLGFEIWIESLGRFDFDDYKVFDMQVQTIFSNPSSLVYHWHHELPLQFPASIVQLDAESFFIGTFQKAGSKLAMNFGGTTNNAFGEMANVDHSPGLSVSVASPNSIQIQEPR